MSKRLRVDSSTAAVEIMKGALTEIAPPGHIRMGDEDWPYWYSVIAEFARTEWTDHQLELAAMLARSMADMEREQFDLRVEGSVLKTEKGTPVVNPRKTVVQMLAGTIFAMRRSLALHARAQEGEARDIRTRSTIKKAVEAGNPLVDDLLSA